MVARALDWTENAPFSVVFLWLAGSREEEDGRRRRRLPMRIVLSIQLFSLYYLLKLYRANPGRGTRGFRGTKKKGTAYNKLKLTKNVKLFSVSANAGTKFSIGTMAAIQEDWFARMNPGPFSLGN